jgi:hypothetical protein
MKNKGLLIRLNQIKKTLGDLPSESFENILRREGFERIGSGSEATVYAKPRCHWVVKVVDSPHRGFGISRTGKTNLKCILSILHSLFSKW